MTPVTVVTWNIQGMAPAWRSRKAQLIAALRNAKPDIVALQECAWRLRHQSSSLGRGLRMHATRTGTLGLLTREKAEPLDPLHLTERARGGSKCVLRARVAGLQVWVAHLPLNAGVRERFAGVLAEQAASAPEPVVLCGDFNERSDAAGMQTLLRHGFVDAWRGDGGYTWPSPDPNSRIDFILTFGAVRAVDTALLAPSPPASDHLGLLTRILLD